MGTDLVCPNCGSDKRYMATKNNSSLEKNFGRGSNWYYCAKCGIKYGENAEKAIFGLRVPGKLR